MGEEIEFETVTVKVPKKIMEFLRDNEENVEEYLKRTIVDDIRAGIYAEVWTMRPREVAGLNAVFKEILNDEIEF